MAGQFEIKKADNGQFIFNLIDSDGQTLFTSEPYAQKSNTRDGIAAVKERAKNIPNYERKKTDTNKLYWVLRDAKGKIIGSSQKHSAIPALEISISAVRKCVLDADIVDLATP